MNKKDAYIYFSPATDITGNNLLKELSITGGKTVPKGKKLVIGWGAKTKNTVKFPKTTMVLNHPDAIKVNRNKFESMRIMAEALNTDGKKRIAGYETADTVQNALDSGTISYPVIGRTKYHQGGKGFWSCPTKAQLVAAIESGAFYFQEMLAVKDEFRLHVFNGEIIHAVKKKQRTNEEFETAFIEDELARQKNLAKKNNNQFDEDTAQIMLRRQAKNATAGGANMLLRSNKLGWKFSIVKKYDKTMAEVAVNAVKALKLDFGAVDCCIDMDGNPYVFEVNTGPGLEGTSLKKYVEAFNKVITEEEKITVKVKSNNGSENISSSSKDIFKTQLGKLQELVDDAESDAELEAIKKIGSKFIFGGK